MGNSVLLNENQRLDWIDICRGLGILLVVLGHTTTGLMHKYIYAFHMPLFFVLSGCLWKPFPDFKSGVCKSLKRYILPYFILSFINLLVETAFLIFKKNSMKIVFKYIIGIIYSRGTVEWMPNCSPLWFLPCLFCVIVIYNFIDNISKNEKIKNIIILFVFGIGYILSLTKMPKLIWNIDTALVAILFFHIGQIVKTKEKILDEKLTVYKFGVVTTLLTILSLISTHYNSLEEISFNNNDYGNLALFLLGSIPIILAIILICKKFAVVCKCNILKFFGKHTLFIMGFDYFSSSIVNMVFNQFLDIEISEMSIGWILCFVCKIIILVIGVILWSFVISKVPNKELRKILAF